MWCGAWCGAGAEPGAEPRRSCGGKGGGGIPVNNFNKIPENWEIVVR